jgi:ABC-2 type transport system ATP-binding protein
LSVDIQEYLNRENLEFVGRVYGVADARTSASEAIARLGLAGREDQLAGELSGGWKQRLALGACILPQPDLLLLDEPTAGVDPKARRDFWNEIHALAAEGLTVLVSTQSVPARAKAASCAATLSSAASPGSDEKTMSTSGSASWASSTLKPRSAARACCCALVSLTLSEWPARCMCVAMGKPILPTPIK